MFSSQFHLVLADLVHEWSDRFSEACPSSASFYLSAVAFIYVCIVSFTGSKRMISFEAVERRASPPCQLPCSIRFSLLPEAQQQGLISGELTEASVGPPLAPPRPTPTPIPQAVNHSIEGGRGVGAGASQGSGGCRGGEAARQGGQGGMEGGLNRIPGGLVHHCQLVTRHWVSE